MLDMISRLGGWVTVARRLGREFIRLLGVRGWR